MALCGMCQLPLGQDDDDDDEMASCATEGSTGWPGSLCETCPISAMQRSNAWPGGLSLNPIWVGEGTFAGEGQPGVGNRRKEPRQQLDGLGVEGIDSPSAPRGGWGHTSESMAEVLRVVDADNEGAVTEERPREGNEEVLHLLIDPWGEGEGGKGGVGIEGRIIRRIQLFTRMSFGG